MKKRKTKRGDGVKGGSVGSKPKKIAGKEGEGEGEETRVCVCERKRERERENSRCRGRVGVVWGGCDE